LLRKKNCSVHNEKGKMAMASSYEPMIPGAATIRAMFMLELAAGMAADKDEVYREPVIRMNATDAAVPATLNASSSLDGIENVVSGAADLAFLNPSSALSVAYTGKGGYFTTPQPVRAVTVLPSRDQCLFAVNSKTGFTHIEDIARDKYPLKLGMRAVRGHWLHNMLDDILSAIGISRADIESWGGEIRCEGHIPRAGTPKFEALARGELTGLFDEGVHGWADEITPAGGTALKMTEETAAKLEAMGYRRDYLLKSRYPTLPEDILTLDFSGWPIFVREDADDDLVRRVCAGLEARKDVIPWDGFKGRPLPLDRMCSDTPEAPLGMPLHPAAEKFWGGCGYL
jgi:TRAP-type uncharacterized transport system substrate-binding protein